MASDPARTAAQRLLAAALSGRGRLEPALEGLGGLSPIDRAFGRALVMACLRHLGPIDAVLDRRLSRPPPAPIRDLMRLGMAQAFWLKVPAFAAVDSVVALAPQRWRGLINAVLRGQLREGMPADGAEELAPAWLMARWRAAYGVTDAAAIAAAIAAEPDTDLTFKAAATPDRLAELGGHALAGGTIRTPRRGELSTWPGFAEGEWWVQDAAAAVPGRLLPQPGQTVLDLCAAPGGKTLQLASGGATVTAVDRSESRLQRLRENLKRIGLLAELVVADATDWSDERGFDAVLLDAPCSATGAFRRHPDVLWNARPGDIAALAGAQAKLLRSAARRVKPGGLLVYSVCSLEKEEGEAQLADFLAADHEFSIAPIASGEGGSPVASLTPQGWLRILPHHLDGGIDGFFIARLRRRA